MTPKLQCEDLAVRLDKTEILHGIDLSIPEGELFFLLGPSGCGKTTLLRTIGGFYRPNRGRVFVNGADVTPVPPHRRDTPMVFQNYALWPHMSVFDNVAHGLVARRTPAAEVRKRVEEALRLVRLEEYAKRRPNQLSGGQQQRVALARALVVDPQVLLLDEPLSNLDAKLRVDMRDELKSLHRRLGLTTIYVTHDQEEALSMADRMAVMRDGRIVQVGTPVELYTHPQTSFVATFLGEANVVPGKRDGQLLRTPLGAFEGGGDVAVVRPEDIALGQGSLQAIVKDVSFQGAITKYRLAVLSLEIIAYGRPGYAIGSQVRFGVSEGRVCVVGHDEGVAA